MPNPSLILDPEYRICHFRYLGHFSHVMYANNFHTTHDACSYSCGSTPSSFIGLLNSSDFPNEAFATCSHKPGKSFQALVKTQFAQPSQQLQVLILCFRKPYTWIQDDAPRADSGSFGGFHTIGELSPNPINDAIRILCQFCHRLWCATHMHQDDCLLQLCYCWN